jgi:hypothetical protein
MTMNVPKTEVTDVQQLKEDYIRQIKEESNRQIRNAVALDVMLKLIERHDNPFTMTAPNCTVKQAFEYAEQFVKLQEL